MKNKFRVEAASDGYLVLTDFHGSPSGEAAICLCNSQFLDNKAMAEFIALCLSDEWSAFERSLLPVEMPQ